jgi:hypothetical protein
MFPLGQRGGSTKGASSFHVRNLVARFENERWRFEGEIRPTVPVDTWECALRLSECGEDGADIAAIAISLIDTHGDAESEVVDGAVVVRVRGPALTFSGESVPLARRPGGRRAITLEAKSQAGAAA